MKFYGIYLLTLFLLSGLFSYGQKLSYELLTTEKVLVTPVTSSNAQLTKVYVESLDSMDSLYRGHLQQLFLKEKYSFVSREEADWIMRYGVEFENVFSMRGARNKGQRSTEVARGAPATRLEYFSGTELLQVRLKLYNAKNELLDSVILVESIDLTGESSHNSASAENRYNEKVKDVIPVRARKQLSLAYHRLAENYFTVERVFPIYAVSFKTHKKRFQQWNHAVEQLKKWAADRPVDAESSLIVTVKSTFDEQLKATYDKTMEPLLYRSSAYYQRAVIEYFQRDYKLAHQLMKKAIELYPLMDNRQQQLWFTLEEYRQHGMLKE